ncbi:MAG: YDG domain-containing protein [Thermoguttaceae bacterium]
MKKLLSRSLRLENLENRILLAVIAGADPAMTAAPQPTSSSYLVTTLADTVDASDGAMSLREAIIAAVTGDTITFASSLAGGTITLSGAALTITGGITIDATGIAGAGGITIDGNNASRIFFIDGGSATNPVVLNHLKITGGYASGSGGAIRVSTGRHLTLIDCAITGNVALSEAGGVYNDGTINLYGCTIAGNTCQSGTGGVYSTNIAYLYNTIIAENFGNQGSGQDYACGSKGKSYAYYTLSSCHKWTTQQGCILYNGGILFTNAAGGDYTLAPQSLAIDQGDNTYATWATDLAGNPRISSLVVDIGAYEYQFPVVPGVTVTGYTGEYDGALHGVTVNGTQSGDVVRYSTDGGQTYSATAPTILFGSQTVHVKVSRANYSDWIGSADITITQKQLTVTGTTVSGKTYDGTTGAAITLGTVNGAIATDDVTVTPSGAFPSANVGDYGVTVTYTISGAQAGYYLAPVPDTCAASITPAGIAGVTVTGYTGTYDGAPHGVTVSGTQSGDTIFYSTDGGQTYSTTPSEFFVGNRTVHVKVSRANHSDWLGAANVNIARKQLTVTGTTVADKVYDGTTNAPVTIGAVSGRLGTDDVTVTASGAFASANVGTHTVTVTYALTGAAAAYYIAPATETFTASITKADPAPDAYTVTGYTGAYDGALHGVTVNGTQSGDTVQYSADGVTYSTTPVTILFGTQHVYVKVSRANYNDWTGSADINITQKQLTVTGTTVTGKTYDGTTGAAIVLGTVDGAIGTDDVTVTPSGAFPSADVGDYQVTVTYALSGAASGYYLAPVADTCAASITPADITGVTVTGYTGTYDGVAHGVTVSGTQPGDTITYSYNVGGGLTSGTTPPTFLVGSATVFVQVSRANHNDWFGAANVNIARKQLTVTGTTVADKVYDGTTSAPVTIGTVAGRLGTDDVNVTATGAFASANVGTHTVTVTYTLTGADADYYIAPATETFTASITKADPAPDAYTLAGYIGTYDGAKHGITITGTEPGDTVQYSTDGGLTYSGTVPEFFVGNKTVHVKISRPNYNDWTGSADIDIAQKQLTITGTSVVSKTYDGTTSAAIALGTVSGIIVGDDVTVTPSGAFPSADVGDYQVAVTYGLTGAAAQYYLAPAADTCAASITPAGITGITVTGYTGTYDGAPHGITITGTQPGDAILYSTDGGQTSSATPPEFFVGNVTVRVKVSRANHNDWFGAADVNIARKQLTVTGTTVADKVYDGTTHATVNLGAVSGRLGTDDVNVTATGAFASANVGTHTVTVTYALTGADANYYIAPASETFTASITKADPAPDAYTLAGYTGTYDGAKHGITVTGTEPGDTILYSTDGVTYSGIAPELFVGSATVYVKISRPNYNDWTGSADINITPKQLTVSGTTVANKTYDGTTGAVITLGAVDGVIGTDAVTVTPSGAFPSANVGDYQVAVTYALSGAEAQYYLAPADDTCAASITAANITGVTLTGYAGTYDGDEHGITVNGTEPGDAVLYSTNGGQTYSATAPQLTVGSATVHVKVSRANHNDWLGVANINIARMQLTVSGTTVADKVYDGTTHATVTRGTVDGIIAGDAVTVTAAGAFPSANAGTHTVTVTYTLSGPDAKYYVAPASETFTASIAKADPAPDTYTLTGYTETYDGANHGITVTGLVPGDTAYYSTNGVDYGLAAPERSFGSVTVYVKISRPNYNDWTGSADINITPKQLTVSGTMVASKVYDGTTDAAITLGSVEGIIAGDDLTVTPSGAFSSADVGDYQVAVTYGLSGADTEYYLAPVDDTCAASIAPATIEGVTLTGYTGTYNGAEHGITITGTKPGDTILYSTNGGDYSATAPQLFVGSATVSVKVSRANHNDWTGSANINIARKQLTVTGTSVADKVYDGTTTAAITLGAVVGIIDGDAVTVTPSGAFPASDVGDYQVAVTYALSGPDAGYYLAPANDLCAASIVKADPAPDTYTLTDYTGVYDGAKHGITVTGTEPGDMVVYSTDGGQTYSGTAPQLFVGSQTVHVRIGRANYNDWFGSAAIDIARKQLTVSGTTVADKVYDGKTTAAITLGTVNGIVAGDNVTVTPSGAFSSADVGDYQVTVAYAITGDDYYLAPVDDTCAASITPANITGVTITGYTGTYNGAAHGVTLTGTKSGDTILYSTDGGQTYSATAPEFFVGGTTVHVKISRANHNDWTGSANINIARKQLTVSGTTVADKEYDGTTAATITLGPVTGIIAGDDVTVTPSGAFSSPNVGDYQGPVSYALSGADIGYYFTPAYDVCNASITEADPAPDAYTLTGYTGIYDGTKHGVTLTGIEPGDQVAYSTDGGQTYSATPPQIFVGNQTVLVRVARANYTDWSGTAMIDIARRPLTVTGTTVADKEYDGTTYAAITLGTVNGIVAGDNITVTPSGAFSSANVGDYQVTVTYAITGTDYYLAPADDTCAASITPADPGTDLYKLTGYTGVYDGVAHGIIITGLEAGDTVQYSTDGIHYDANAPTLLVGSATVYVIISRPNYGDWTGSADINIAPKQLTITGTKVANKEYDGTTSATVTLGTLSGIVGDDDVTVTGSSAFPASDVGDYQVTVTYAISGPDVGYYLAPASGFCTASITEAPPAPDTYTLTGYTGIYDGTKHGVTIEGLEPGDMVVYSTDGGQHQSPTPPQLFVGSATVLVRISRPNYTDWSGTAIIDIARKPLTVTGTTVADKVYDGTTGATIALGTIHGIVAGDSVTVTPSGAFSSADVGDYQVAVTYAVTGTDYYLAPADDTCAASITKANPAPSTYALTGYSGVYDGIAHGITISGLESGDTVRYSTDGIHYVTHAPTLLVGSATVYVKISRANYNDWTGSADIDIARKQLTVAGTKANTKEYDGTTSATVTLGKVDGIVPGDDVTVTPSGAFPASDVGDYQVTVTYGLTGADIDYYLAPTNCFCTASIVEAPPAPDTYTLTGYTGTYDGSKHGVTIEGLEPGDQIGYSIDGGQTYSATAPKLFVGDQTVLVRIARPNYTDWSGTADISIARKQLTVGGTTVADKEYDGTTDATIILGAVHGIVAGDHVIVTPSGVFPSADVGDYNVSVNYTFTGSDYYLAPAADTCAASITKAGITGVTVTGYNGTYDGAAHGITVTGTKPGDTILYSTDGVNYGEAAPEILVGSETVRVKVSRANHNDWTGSADINIARKQLTVTGTKVANKQYDGTTNATVTLGTVDGILGDDDVTVTPSGAFPASDVDDYQVTVTYGLSGADAGYYLAPIHCFCTASITEAPLAPETFTLTGYTGTYDGAKHGVTIEGLEPGDMVVYSTDGGQTQSPNAPELFVGSATVLVRIARPNYADWSGTADIDIARKQLTVTETTVADKVYDGTTDAAITLGTVHGIVAGDNVTVTPSGAFSSADVGDYQVAVTYAITGSDYYLAPAADTCAASITAAAIEGVTLTGYTGTYDGAAHTITVDGASATDTILYSTDGVNYSEDAPEFFVGSETVYVKISRANHNDWTGSADINIARKQLTVTGTSVASKVYDGTTDAAITLGTVAGILVGDDVSVTPSGAFPSANVDVYDVAVTYALTGAESEYYLAPAADTCNASITPATIEGVTVTDYTGAYDGAAHGVTLTGTLPDDVVFYSTDGEFYSKTVPQLLIGSETVYVRVGRVNHVTWSGLATIDIAPKQLTVTGTTVADKPYDGTTDADVTLGTVEGVLGTDDVTVAATGTFAGSDYGEHTVTVTYMLSGADAGYYAVPASETFTARILRPLDAPTILTGDPGVYVSYGANRHRLLWTAIENASAYELTYSADGGGTWSSVTSGTTSGIVRGLSYGDDMVYRVRALGTGAYCDSDWSVTRTFNVCPMDVDNDGDIGPTDLALVLNLWLKSEDDAEYRHYCDIDGDGDIGPTDRVFLKNNWLGESGSADLFYPRPLPAAADTVFDEFGSVDLEVDFDFF